MRIMAGFVDRYHQDCHHSILCKSLSLELMCTGFTMTDHRLWYDMLWHN